jgi:restriction system protein
MANMVKGPQFVRFFGPVLEALKSLGGSGQPSEVKDFIAQKLAVPEGEIAARMESGASRYGNQVDWARFYLSKAGLLDSSIRGVWRLTDEGRATSLTMDQAVALFKKVHKQLQPIGDAGKRVEEQEEQEQEIDIPEHAGYRDECLALLQGLTSAGFERFCQGLLRESGFESVTVTGKSGDGGIDGIGILQVGPFVSFRVFFQCKKYAGSIGPDKIRDFRGAMADRTDKGIVLTTGVFTAEAKREAVRDGTMPIELVDTDKLLDIMEKLEIGLKPKGTFDVDQDFFRKFQ